MTTETETLGTEFQISTYTAGNQENPSVTALSGGGFVVAWQSQNQDGSGYGVYGQRYDADGTAQGTEFRKNTYIQSYQGDPSVTALSSGGFVVAWQSFGQDGGDFGVHGQRYDANGNKQGGEFQANTYTDDDQENPSVTGLSNGGFVVTWQSQNQDGDDNGIHGQRYDANGTAVGDEFRVNSTTAGDQTDPSVTGLSGGGFVVTWQSGDGSGDGVYAQRYDADGNAQGTESRINTHTAGNQENPSVTALSGGGFVVAWDSEGQDGSLFGVHGQRYDAEGNAQGAEFREFQINSHTQGFQENPSVTGLSDGGFVVTWESFGQDGSGDGVYGQRYDAQGNA